MDDKLDFTIFCIENYKTEKRLTGSETVVLFDKYRVFEFIDETYEALHTIGTDYIIDDISGYITTQQNTQSE